MLASKLILCFLSILVFGSIFVITPNAYSATERTIDVQPDKVESISIKLKDTQKLEFVFVVDRQSSSDNDKIVFWIEDPNNDTVFGEVDVDLGYRDNYVAENSGNHFLYFKNTDTDEGIGFNSKNIRLSYNIEETVDNSNGGGCLIATATYGSELSHQVQFLREVRDSTLLSTTSGSSFMTGFNQLYYSFSPTIADWERENLAFREAVKLFITPMILTLSIMTLADEGSESEVLGLGIFIITLNLGMYIAIPTIVIVKVRGLSKK